MYNSAKVSRASSGIITTFLNQIDSRIRTLDQPNEVPPDTDSPGEIIQWQASRHKIVNPHRELSNLKAELHKTLAKCESKLDAGIKSGEVFFQLADFLEGEADMPQDLDPDLKEAAILVKQAARTGAADAQALAVIVRKHAQPGLAELMRLKNEMILRWRKTGLIALGRQGSKYLLRCVDGVPPTSRKAQRLRITAEVMADIAQKRQAAYRKKWGHR